MTRQKHAPHSKTSDSPTALLTSANQLFSQGRAHEARDICHQIVQMQPDDLAALQLLGLLQIVTGQPDDAIVTLRNASSLDRRNTRTLCLQGMTHTYLNQPQEALSYFDQAVALDPHQPAIWYDRGNALRALGRAQQALQSFDRALALAPGFADGWFNRGHALLELQRPGDAVASFENAARAAPRDPQVWFYLAESLHAAGRFADALTCYDRSLAIDDRNAEAWISAGDLLRDMGRADLALQRYDRAVPLAPDSWRLWANRANALEGQKGRLNEAIESLQKAQALAPMHPVITGNLMHYLLRAARWGKLAAVLAAELRLVRDDASEGDAFPILAHPDATADDVLRVCRRHADAARGDAHPVPRAPEVAQPPGRRLRIGYLSADLRHHAVGLLMAGVLEAHDKARFEPFAFSINPQPDSSADGERIRRAFDHFIDLRAAGNTEAAALIASYQIDILIDLSGHTAYGRPGIVERRPAAVQVNYLGFPATSGMREVDYILGDRWVTPDGSADEFSEHIVRLPDSFQANDDRRIRPVNAPKRAALNLPDDGFVFCCFNNTYKINPRMFDIWMRLLTRVPGSVLWLIADEKEAEANFRHEAEARGVAGTRLVFAPRVSYEQYLARFRQADLFLDTLPFNAGTTASDALWMGLPVLTQLGTSFAGRMAASLLDNVELPELITRSADEYEALALRLATEPGLLQGYRDRLTTGLTTVPLFDTARFTRHLERAYEMMWARRAQGLPPAAFDVPALESPLPAEVSAAPAGP